MTTFREAVTAFYARIGDDTLPLGLGCATLGRRGDDALYRQFRATLDAAYESGVRYFDTAEKYGESEARVGEFLRTVPRESVFLATKSTLPEPATPGAARDHLRRAVRVALERLGVDRIDLFQVHDVESLDATLADGGALDALREARAEGLIRYVGLGTRQHDLLLQAARHPDFDTILTFRDYLPIHPVAAPLIEEAWREGKGVINGSPLAFGLLTGDDPRVNPRLTGENLPLVPAAGELYNLCATWGVPLLGVALRFPLDNPEIALTLTGPGSPEEWRATVAALAVPVPAEIWRGAAKIRLKHAALNDPRPPKKRK
jgi:aryl-alcohol dehydrogenase-like predicted oxidoreductase